MALASILLSCQDSNDTPTTAPPLTIKPATRDLPEDPRAAIAALLTTCHGVLAGKDKMNSALMHLRRDTDDELPEQIILWTESRMRLVRRNRQVDIRLTQGAWRLTPPDRAVAHDDTETAKLDRLQGLLRAALLAPLYNAEKVHRQGPRIYQLILAGGATWRLELRSFQPARGSAVLLPWTLSGPPGKLTWIEYLHTGVTHLPKRIELGEFGKQLLSLESSDLTLDESWFTDPLAPDRAAPTKAQPLRRNANIGGFRPGKPIIGFTRASRSLVFVDPGSWPARALDTAKHGRVLRGQGQESDDLDFLFQRDGVWQYAIPFTMDQRPGVGRPFAAKPGQEVLRLTRQRAIIMRTRPQQLEDAIAGAQPLLAEFAKAQKLQVIGPLRVRCFVEMEQIQKGKVVGKVEIQFELPVKAP